MEFTIHEKKTPILPNAGSGIQSFMCKSDKLYQLGSDFIKTNPKINHTIFLNSTIYSIQREITILRI